MEVGNGKASSGANQVEAEFFCSERSSLRDYEYIVFSDSSYCVRVYTDSILSDVSIEEALKGVIAALPEDNIDPDSDCDIEDMKGVLLGNRDIEGEVKKSQAVY